MQVESTLLFETPEEICARVFRELRPRARLPEIEFEFCPFADANSFARLDNGRLYLRVTDILRGAPAPVLEALVHILLCKLFRRPVPRACNHRYRLYLNRRDTRRNLERVRQERGRKMLTGPRGEHYDLECVFEELNWRHFHGLMSRPALSWSRRASRSVLGHYDPAHNAIIISRLLDSAEAPRLALDYVVFHEMLHLRYPIDHKGARRRVHTREFREAEKAFAGLKTAKELLKRL